MSGESFVRGQRGEVMPRRKVILLAVLLLLYAVTWVGGWHSHSRQLRDETEATYLTCKQHNREVKLFSEHTGMPPPLVKMHEGGPVSRVSWCLPVLPGVLLAQSDHSIGPLLGRGGVKVILWYGVGSTELCMLGGWIA